MIVLLRIGIGWHFLYEGVHKFEPNSGFSSEGFLGIAKGPTADMYYWMLTDLDGTERLAMEKIPTGNVDAEGFPLLVDGVLESIPTFIVYDNAWKEYFRDYLVKFSSHVKKEDAEAIVDKMSAKEIAQWVVQKVPFNKVGDEDFNKLSRAELDEIRRVQFGMVVPAGVPVAFSPRVPFAVGADADAIVNANVARLTTWLEQNVTLPKAVAAEVAEETKETLAAVLEKGVSSSEEDATAIDDKNVALLAAWVEEAKIVVRGKKIFDQYLGSLREVAAEEQEDVEAFLASRERFLETKSTIRNMTSFEQERRWRQMIQYRDEAGRWIRKFDTMGNSLQSDLGRLADPLLAGQRGEIITAPERELIPPNSLGIKYTIPPNPYVQTRMQAMDYAVMFGLSAIGLCLVLGFCTRLACLGGAVFLANVVLTTFPVPGVYPAIPSMVGNFMFVTKDVVELLALLVLTLVPAGRWGGLDYFLWHYGGKQIVGLFCPCSCSAEKTAA